MVQTGDKDTEEPYERIEAISRLPEDVCPESLQIIDDRLHQANKELI